MTGVYAIHDTSIDHLARIILNNRETVRGLLDVYGYAYNHDDSKQGEKSFIKAASEALFNNPDFLAAADAMMVTAYNRTSGFIGAIITAVASITSATVGAVNTKKGAAAAKDIAALDAKSRLTSAYLSLWSTQAASDSMQMQGAYGLQSAREYVTVAKYAGIGLFAVSVTVALFWFLYKFMIAK